MFPIGLNVSDDGNAAEFVFGAYISHDAFRLLRAAPLLGRDFLPEEDAGGAASTAILSHRLWMTRYGGDPEIIGGGREPGCPGPPAQIRTCALAHTAPTLGG